MSDLREVSKVERFDHDPMKMLEETPRMYEGKRLRAAFIVILDEDDRLFWHDAAFQNKDLLWAMEKTRLRLITE